MQSGSRVTLRAACWLSLILVVGLFSQGCQHIRPNFSFAPLPTDNDQAMVEANGAYVPRPDRRIFYVGGEVRMPGRQEYLGPTTVTKAIESAGGFTERASSHVQVTRPNRKLLVVNCVEAKKTPTLDLPVYPNDKLEALPRSWRDLFR